MLDAKGKVDATETEGGAEPLVQPLSYELSAEATLCREAVCSFIMARKRM